MTNKEAIARIRDHKIAHKMDEPRAIYISEALDKAIEALEKGPCEDCISREAVNTLVDELARAISDERCCMSRGRSTATIMQDILELPPVMPLTPYMLADALMEERIRGKLDSDITFEKDVIPDVKCRLTVDIIDHRPCYCGAELREVWRESEVKE